MRTRPAAASANVANFPPSTHQHLSLPRQYSLNKLQDRLGQNDAPSNQSLRIHSPHLPRPPVRPEQILVQRGILPLRLKCFLNTNQTGGGFGKRGKLSPLNTSPSSAGTPRTNPRTARRSSRQAEMFSQCEPDRRRPQQTWQTFPAQHINISPCPASTP